MVKHIQLTVAKHKGGKSVCVCVCVCVSVKVPGDFHSNLKMQMAEPLKPVKILHGKISSALQ